MRRFEQRRADCKAVVVCQRLRVGAKRAARLDADRLSARAEHSASGRARRRERASTAGAAESGTMWIRNDSGRCYHVEWSCTGWQGEAGEVTASLRPSRFPVTGPIYSRIFRVLAGGGTPGNPNSLLYVPPQWPVQWSSSPYTYSTVDTPPRRDARGSPPNDKGLFQVLFYRVKARLPFLPTRSG